MGPKLKIAVMHRATIAPLKKWVIKAINQFSDKTCRDFGTCHMVVLKRPAETAEIADTAFTSSTAFKTTSTAHNA